MRKSSGHWRVARACFGFGILSLVAGDVCAAGAGAFVGVENVAGVWWFRSPAGERFLSFGVNHVEPVYWQSPGNTSFVLVTYGPDLISKDGRVRDGSPAAETWARRVATNLADWGFNTLGFHNPLSKSLQSAGSSYYVVELDLKVPWGWNMPRSALVKAFRRRPFDIFSGGFAAAVEANAAVVVKAYADDARVLGYAYTDGPPWTVDDDPESAGLTAAQKAIHPWVLALMSLPGAAEGKRAWLSTMKGRYPSAEKAAATYACDAAAWDALASKTDWGPIGDPVRAAQDSQAFLEELMRRWYEIRGGAIRRYDRNHLILGDKLNMNRDSRHPEQLIRSLAVMSPHVDLINIQYYGSFAAQRGTLALLHRETRKPVLNGDTTFRPLWKDPGPNGDSDYRQLGESYAEDLRRLFSLPYFIGWHHCGYMRGLRSPYLEARKRGDRKAAEYYEANRLTYREGFITELEEPIVPIIGPVSAAISQCEGLHRASGGAP